MRARLLIRTGEFKGLTEEITGDFTLGRSKKCKVLLNSPLVSSQHARITLDPNQQEFFLEDLSSLNGTELDGVPVRGRERLGRLHVIRLSGKFDLIWQGAALCAQRSTETKPAGAGGYSDRTIEEKLPLAIPSPDSSRTREPTDLNKTLMDAGPLDLQAFLQKASDPDAPDQGVPEQHAADDNGNREEDTKKRER